MLYIGVSPDAFNVRLLSSNKKRLDYYHDFKQNSRLIESKC